MKTTLDCIPCILQSILRLFNNGIIEKNYKEKIFKKILKQLSEENLALSPPKIAQKVHRIIREEIKNNDPYKKIKDKYNSICLSIYKELKDKVLNSTDPFFEALKLSIVGNIIDFGPNHSFDLLETVSRLEKFAPAIDDSSTLKNDIKNSENILYLGDNAGEIVFDKLFLETIDHPNVKFAVRGAPTINDATRSDALSIGLDKIASIIETGMDLPGILLEESSNEFVSAYNNSDLIISKGQGNYESLSDIKNKNIYFLLMVKCDLVAEQLSANKGDIVIKCVFRGK